MSVVRLNFLKAYICIYVYVRTIPHVCESYNSITFIKYSSKWKQPFIVVMKFS